jgi:hypothetical protein
MNLEQRIKRFLVFVSRSASSAQICLTAKITPVGGFAYRRTPRKLRKMKK